MIRFVFRWAFRLLLLAVVLAIGLLLLKDTIARNVAEERIRKETGFDTKIGKLEFSLLAPRLTIENLVLYNPPEFGGSIFLDIPELHLEYNRKELALGKIQLGFLRLDLREFHIVENQQGRTNLLDVLHRVAPEIIGAPAPPDQRYDFKGIDTLNLSIAVVRYSNLRLPKRNQEVKLGLRNDISQNIRSEQDIAALLFKILLRAGITIYTDSKATPALPKNPRGNAEMEKPPGFGRAAAR